MTVDGPALVSRLVVLAAEHEATSRIHRVELYKGSFPVDIRHNAKINREKLTVWANERLPPTVSA